MNAPEPGIVSRRQNFRSASNNLLDLVCIVLVTRVWPCVNMLYFKMPPACLHDNVSEWLRRWTRNPLGSAREGSNPFVVAFLSKWISHTCIKDVNVHVAFVWKLTTVRAHLVDVLQSCACPCNFRCADPRKATSNPKQPSRSSSRI